MNLTLLRWQEQLRANLWFVPAIGVVLSFVLAGTTLVIDHEVASEFDGWALVGGDATSAQQFLQAVASATTTIAAVLFSVTMLVLQQANTQLSARIIRSFLRDPGTQVVLAVFLGTFVYALLVLWEVRAPADGDAFVPVVSMMTAIALVVLSVAFFIFFIHHVAQSIRPTTIVGGVARETRQLIDDLYPGGIGQEPAEPVERPRGEPTQVVHAAGPGGVLNGVDERRIEAVAKRYSCVMALVPLPGDYIREGAPLVEVWGKETVDEAELNRAVSLTRERAMVQDIAFGFRQLVDIAIHALPPSQNDPTTAVQVLDQIHGLLGRMLTRPFPSSMRLNDQGELRMILPRPDWGDLVHLSLDEIRQSGAGSVQVARRIRYLLNDLLEAAPEDRAPALREQLELLEESIDSSPLITRDREQTRHGSRQGHGPE